MANPVSWAGRCLTDGYYNRAKDPPGISNLVAGRTVPVTRYGHGPLPPGPGRSAAICAAISQGEVAGKHGSEAEGVRSNDANSIMYIHLRRSPCTLQASLRSLDVLILIVTTTLGATTSWSSGGAAYDVQQRVVQFTAYVTNNQAYAFHSRMLDIIGPGRDGNG